MKVLIIGSSNTDFVFRSATLPKPGETLLGSDFMINAGGKGANQAVGAARLSKNVTFCCKVGNDVNGQTSKANFVKEGMNTEYVLTTDEVPSGVAMINVDDNAENNIVVVPGANMKLTPEDIDNIKDFGEYGIVLVQLEIPVETVTHIAKLTAKFGNKLILNPAPARELPAELLQNTNIITPNETEAEFLTGVKVTDDASALKAAEALCKLGPETAIITLGRKGSFVHTSSISKTIPTYKSKPVDTTAAGDVFNGALAVALSEGKDIENAILFASAAGSIAVTRKGAQPSAPTRAEVDDVVANSTNDQVV